MKSLFSKLRNTADVDTSLAWLVRVCQNALHYNVDTKLLACTFAFVLLSGCASAPSTEYRVTQLPEPPVINRPELPVLKITKDMDPGTIIQLHRETIKVLESWGLELEAALDAYRKKKDLK